MPLYGDSRDDIADTLMKQRGASSFDYGLAGLGSAAPAASPMTGPTIPGLPATPPGGVPGAGIAPAGPSVLPTPPQRPAIQGALPGMGSLGAGMGGLGAPPGLGMAPGLGGGMPPGVDPRGLRRRAY